MATSFIATFRKGKNKLFFSAMVIRKNIVVSTYRGNILLSKGPFKNDVTLLGGRGVLKNVTVCDTFLGGVYF